MSTVTPSARTAREQLPGFGGAPIGPADTAWAYRDARWNAVYAGVDPNPANADAIRDQSRLRPRQRVPRQPEHPAGLRHAAQPA